MTDGRRYHDDEIDEIFRAAAAEPDTTTRHHLASTHGLSLEELQAIGREVGLAPERIAEAASALELRRGALPRRNHLGLPIAVGRTVELPRAPTEREWAQLVAELRGTFRAQGKVESFGGSHRWSNGNLHAYIEPTGEGYRLRLGTLKSDAVPLSLLGITALATAIILMVAQVVAGTLAADPVAPLLFGAAGAITLVSNVLRLPRWAGEREEQMEYIAARARALLGPGGPGQGQEQGQGDEGS